ncbi:uncharacterized protein UDID_04496 [Ustilago sp. UG-2017a]|nr:uncharacterized protein UDID_04496 [Ustilago sp. UG-2017a]
MASFKSLLLALMLTLMAAYNASCYILPNDEVIWKTGETLDQGARRLEALVLAATSTDTRAVPHRTPQNFFTELDSVGRLSEGQEDLKGRDWNSWINAYLVSERRRLGREQQNTARSDRPSG